MNTINNQTEQIILHHLSSFQENDLDEVMADYTTESKLITPKKTFTGLQEIRDFLAELSIQFPVGKSSISLDQFTVEDNLGYIVWNGKTPSIEVSLASDTFIIQNGKIHRQTFIGDIKYL